MEKKSINMAELNFPAEPVKDQIYAEPGFPVYRFNGQAWDCLGASFGETPPPRYLSYSFSHGVIDPVDGMTYYIGDFPDLQPSSVPSDSFGVISQVTGTIDNLTHTVAIVGATSDATEHSTIEIHNLTRATSVTANSELHFAESNSQYNYNGLSLLVEEGDLLQLVWVTPVWLTNPTQVRQRFTLKISV